MDAVFLMSRHCCDISSKTVSSKNRDGPRAFTKSLHSSA